MEPGALLRERRLHYGLDQRKLAYRAGTSQSHVARVERGEVSPSVATLRRLLAALGERLDLAAKPLAPNPSVRELREDLDLLTPADRVRQAAELSYAVTTIAAANQSLVTQVAQLRGLDILRTLREHEVEFLVIGSFSLVAHGFVRGTKDVDIVPEPSRKNLERLFTALAALAAEPAPVALDLVGGNCALHTKFGQLDVMQDVAGVAGYEALRARAIQEAIPEVGGAVWFAGRDDLIRMKAAAGRPQDIVDIQALEQARRAT